jgi:hypothetical protein
MDIGPRATHATAAAAAAPPALDDVRIIENNNIQVNNRVLNDVDVFCMSCKLKMNFKN